MALLPRGLRRSVALKLMPKAFASGLSVSKFIRQLRGTTGSYKKTTLLSDWRTIVGIETKKDAMKYVRKDRIPSPQAMADVEWGYSKEYVYKANTWSRIHPDDPLTERMVTFQADKVLTAREVEEQIAEKWEGYEKYFPYKLERVDVVQLLHMTPLAQEVE